MNWPPETSTGKGVAVGVLSAGILALYGLLVVHGDPVGVLISVTWMGGLGGWLFRRAMITAYGADPTPEDRERKQATIRARSTLPWMLALLAFQLAGAILVVVVDLGAAKYPLLLVMLAVAGVSLWLMRSDE